jgi:pyruvate/2-oxoglutarate dehydrogenase complex dihydrolipoamide dehydrogenase (E3) component
MTRRAATGRDPNTEGLGLELTGVELTDRGYIKVNERLLDHRARRMGDRRGRR